jgi:hypothetical protein
VDIDRVFGESPSATLQKRSLPCANHFLWRAMGLIATVAALVHGLLIDGIQARNRNPHAIQADACMKRLWSETQGEP